MAPGFLKLFATLDKRGNSYITSISPPHFTSFLLMLREQTEYWVYLSDFLLFGYFSLEII